MFLDYSMYMMIISSILIISMAIFILSVKHKKQIHYIFLANMSALIFWNFGILLEVYYLNKYNISNNLATNMTYIGICFLPVFLLFTGIIFANTKLKFRYYYLLMLVIPLSSILILITNKYHHLFYIKYLTLISLNNEYGAYFYFHSAFSYSCIAIGLYILSYYSIKNSGFFSKQSIAIIIGSIIPTIVNILYTTQIVKLGPFATPSAFSFAIICFTFGILRYNFLSITPIALQKVVDHISDAYIVIDEGLNIVDYNQALINNFSELFNIKRKYNLIDSIKYNKGINIDTNKLLQIINKVRSEGGSIVFEKNIISKGYDKFFTIEITPIYSQKSFTAMIILFKDITEHKKNIKTLKEQQEILLEQERLASLGQLIGGIAHNLKTPIMSIAGGMEALRDLTFEYRDSIDDRSVTEADHKEIAKEMLSWLDRMKPYCSYMSDVISAVKGQAVQMSASSSFKFTVDELIKRVDLLLKHELKKYHCILTTETHIDMSTEIKGEVNNLVQVFDNIIINAMQAYEGENGTIDLKVVRSGDNVEFTFKDYGKGISKQVADKLFKEMITTKGKNGTGLGLYMSYSTIKGRFGGSMSFSSKEGCGTTFFISIPCITYSNQEAG